MKILFIDLGNGYESFSANPDRYGGGRALAVGCRQNMDYFYTLAHPKSYSPISKEDKENRMLAISTEQTEKIRAGEEIFNVLPGFKQYDFDLIIHANSSLFLNTELPQLVWVIGYGETVNPKHKNILVHNFNGQKPVISNLDANIYEFVLGIDIPPFEENEGKEDLIFQCTNHYSAIQSHLVADICVRNHIMAVFAGPVSEDYKAQFFKYIDNKYTHYMGEITERVKIETNRTAKFFTSLFAHPINETTLAIKTSLSLGTPIITTRRGHMVESIQEGKNGFFVESERQFLRAWDKRGEIRQKDCWDSVQKYSVENMVESLKIIFERIYGN